MSRSGNYLADQCRALLGCIRDSRPRVHCLTSPVSSTLTANVLLAVGAVPSLSSAPGEVEAFVSGSGSLSVNLGMLGEPRLQATTLAVERAVASGIPWTLDPVLVDRSPDRLAFAASLLRFTPSVVRGNANEIDALVFRQGHADVAQFVRANCCVVALTGPTDQVTGAEARADIRNGHPMMGLVTAVGCAHGALIAAFLSICDDAWLGCVCATLALGLAGEKAGEDVPGPGSFQVRLLDALFRLETDTELFEQTRVSWSREAFGG